MKVGLDFSPERPDGFEPIVAYRGWWLDTGLFGAPVLCSMSGQAAHVWTRGWNRATCPRVDRGVPTPGHQAPAEGCSCGFYAVKDLVQISPLLQMRASDRPRVVMGIVELAGTIIEHDFGYRAERARITGIISRAKQDEEAVRAASEYAVSVSPAPSHVSDQFEASERHMESRLAEAKARAEARAASRVTPSALLPPTDQRMDPRPPSRPYAGRLARFLERLING